MEHRTELEEILLAGLPPQERNDTLASIQTATEQKLRHLRSQDDDPRIGLDDNF